MPRFLDRVWRWLRAEIVLGFVIATVFWAGILGWQAANAPTDVEKQKCYDDAKHVGYKAEECKTIWERTTSDPVAFFTFWLVIFTGGLTASTVLLWRAGERQLRLLRRTALIQSRDMQESTRAAQAAARSAAESAYSERAWMTTDGFEPALGTTIIFDGVTYPEGIGIAPRWKNTGRSPAVRVDIFTEHRMERADNPIIPRFDAPIPENLGVVGPSVTATGVQRWICGDDLGNFRLGALKCFIYSRVSYGTIFEPDLAKTSEICCCIEYNGEQQISPGNTVPRLLYNIRGPQNTAS
jgi:hypothetical protein